MQPTETNMQSGDRITWNGYETANERMKRRSGTWYSSSLVLAVLLHFALFGLTPAMSAVAMDAPNDPDLIVLPDELDIPDPPEQIDRPAEPIVASVDVPDDVTISSTRLDAWTPEQLAAPVTTDDDATKDYMPWVRSMVAPRLLNPAEVERELIRVYPSILREAGIGGDVDVNLWLDETGGIVKAEVARTSGYKLLDAAALEVVDVMRLAPAQNRGVAVRVIVTLPVKFTVR